jgi:hypothetical protein
VAREHLLRIKTALVHARECVWCHESARGIFDAIDTIAITCDRPYSVARLQGERQAQ